MEESRGSASSSATGMAVGNPRGEWYISIFGVDGPQHDSAARSEHRIPKAPAKFREFEKDKKYFDPRVVSLGPYHHGEDHLKPMEKHKITAVKRFGNGFINRPGERGRIYQEFMKVIGVAKGCYAAEVVAHLTDDVFARMMFFDGCFVLYFIVYIILENIESEISNDQIPLIIWDMFLIENQLPFEVLDSLTSLLLGSSSLGKRKILEFINSEVLMPMGIFYPVDSSRPLNWCGVVDGGEPERREGDGVENDQGVHDRPLHLLDVLRTILLDFPPSEGSKKHNYRPRNFGTVMELKEIGIRFKKRRMKSLMDISFKEKLLFPQLLLPTMFINDTTISKLLNLTALEACSDTYSGCGVTSFIHFMDSLINDDADVKELQSKGILHHSLGSDDKVARPFNKWPASVTNDLQLYSDISTQIRKHRLRKVKIYIATLCDHCFGTPRITSTFLAAFVYITNECIKTYMELIKMERECVPSYSIRSYRTE